MDNAKMLLVLTAIGLFAVMGGIIFFLFGWGDIIGSVGGTSPTP